jgi:hypothetical protein
MPDRQPEPWESSAPGPFVTIEKPHGTVEIHALGEQRFAVKAPDSEQVVVSYGRARQTAQALAEQLDYPT